MATKATVAAGLVGAVAGSLVGGFAAGSLSSPGSPAELETARAEVRELRSRVEAMETAAAPSPGRSDAASQERIAAQERRIQALEAAAARSVPAAPDATTATDGREERTREALDALDRERRAAVAPEKDRGAGLAAVAEKLEQEKQEARRKFLDPSTPEAERASLLEKLRGLRGIDQEVARIVAEMFRASTSPAVRERLLRDMHGQRFPEMKSVFLEALRGDPDELVRERAVRDIDDYLDDPEVVKALEAAKEGDASKVVRDRAARRLRDRERGATRKDD